MTIASSRCRCRCAIASLWTNDAHYSPLTIFDHRRAATTATAAIILSTANRFQQWQEQLGLNLGNFRIMSRKFNTIKEIKPETEHWTTKVKVIEKGHPRPSAGGGHKMHQRLILCDVEGNRVQATIYGSDIDILANKLALFQMYYISNAIVSIIHPRHRIVQNEYQWVINSRTVIDEAFDDQSLKLQSRTFTPMTDTLNHRDSNTEIDILVVALRCLEPRIQPTRKGPTKLQEVIIIDESAKPMCLTLWDQFVDNEVKLIADIIATRPIIMGSRLKVVSHNGTSLTTKATSSITINPINEETQPIRSWLAQNMSMVENLAHSNFLEFLTHPTLSQLQANSTQIADIKNISTPISCFVKCVVQIVNFNQAFFYMGCNHCGRSTSATHMQVFHCNYCNEREAVSIPKYKVEVNASDSSGTIGVTIFGNDADEIFGCSVEAFLLNTDETLEKYMVTSTEEPTELWLQIKPFTSEFHGEVTTKFNVSVLVDPKEVDILLAKIGDSNLNNL